MAYIGTILAITLLVFILSCLAVMFIYGARSKHKNNRRRRPRRDEQLRSISASIPPASLTIDVTTEELSQSRIAEREARLKEITLTGLPSYEEAIKTPNFEPPTVLHVPSTALPNKTAPTQPPPYSYITR